MILLTNPTFEVHLPSGDFALVEGVIQNGTSNMDAEYLLGGEARSCEQSFDEASIDHIDGITLVDTTDPYNHIERALESGSVEWFQVLLELGKTVNVHPSLFKA